MFSDNQADLNRGLGILQIPKCSHNSTSGVEYQWSISGVSAKAKERGYLAVHAVVNFQQVFHPQRSYLQQLPLGQI